MCPPGMRTSADRVVCFRPVSRMDPPPNFRVADWAVFAGLTASSLGTGLYLSMRRRGVQATRDEAFLGNRSIRALPLALSMLASSITAAGIVAFVPHYYRHGFHTLWATPVFVLVGIIVTYLFLPLLYELKVTSIFEYLRMRYGNVVGVAASVIYFVLSQTLGAVTIYAAAEAMTTMLKIPLTASCILLGVAGTAYTALGGLRSVVWADCVQAVIMTGSPLVIIGKVIYDSSNSFDPPRPLTGLNVTAYFLRTDLDLETDETVWAASVAAFPFQLTRVGLDQMITQRFLAARSLPEARTVAFAGISLVSFFYGLIGVTALAVIYWYRDCDPVLSGVITRYDQIVPYYIHKNTKTLDGVRGLFLAGVVSASISTISSVVNSHAAVLFVDIVLPNFRVPERKSALLIACLGAGSGTIMTLASLVLPYVSSAAKGTAWAALGVFAVQTWQTAGRFLSKVEPLSMTYTVDRCAANSTFDETASQANFSRADPSSRPDVLALYRLSPYWCCLFSMCSTVVLGLALSSVTARPVGDLESALRLSSPLMLKLWRRFGFFRPSTTEAEFVAVNEREHRDSSFESQPLQAEANV
ncbi:sodium/iodide cotransporter-like isoform X2 [Amblyomma americanum]